MSPFVESLKRRFLENKTTLEKLETYKTNVVITQEEYNYITTQ